MIARRDFLRLLGTPAAAQLAPPPARFVANDVGPLRRVLVHAPGAETRRGLDLGSGHRLLGGALSERIQEEHLGMVSLLRSRGVEVVTLEQALDQAIGEARRASALAGWLRGFAPQLAPHAGRLTGAALLGAVDEFIYHQDAQGIFQPLAEPMGSIYWSRDAAIMTPRGVMMAQFLNEARTLESILTRFAYEWSPLLRRYPVLFDAAEEQVTMEGGDVMVFDADTLFMGVGNRTSEAAAPRVAAKLNMDVVTVRMPSGASTKRWSDPGARTRLHGALLHLDTICTFVNNRLAVALPYLLEMKWRDRDPLTRMLRGLARLPRVNETDMEKQVNLLKDLGLVRRYRAGSGEPVKLPAEMKLVDYLRELGLQVVFVGGTPPEQDSERHFAETVWRELGRQAANTVALAPGRVLAYAGNPATQRALEQAGVEVVTFAGHDLMRANGGPHCLTQPLERY